MILAIDTSSELTSAGLIDDGVVVGEASHLDARMHAEVLAPMIQSLIADADRSSITAVAVGVGPDRTRG